MSWHLTTEWAIAWVVIIAGGVAGVVWAIGWPHDRRSPIRQIDQCSDQEETMTSYCPSCNARGSQPHAGWCEFRLWFRRLTSR